MVVVLASDLTQDWFAKVCDVLADRAMVLPTAADGALDLAHRLPVSVFIVNAEPLTTDRILAYQSVTRELREAVLICLAPQDIKELVRNEKLLAPDFWIAPGAELAEVEEILRLALEKASLLAATGANAITVADTSLLPPASERFTAEEGVLRQLLAAMAGNTSPERLLDAYVDAAVQLVRCASHCFLFRDPARDVLAVRTAQGLPTQLATRSPGPVGRTRGLVSQQLPRPDEGGTRALARCATGRGCRPRT